MRDPVLDLQIQEVTVLMSELKTFRDIVVSTLNTEVVVPENETRLEKLKETVAEAAKKLYSDLCEDYDDTAEKVIDSVESLPRLIKYTNLEKRTVLEMWHKYYMNLHVMIGELKSRKEKVESLNTLKLHAQRALFSPATLIVLLAVIVFVVFMYLSR